MAERTRDRDKIEEDEERETKRQIDRRIDRGSRERKSKSVWAVAAQGREAQQAMAIPREQHVSGEDGGVVEEVSNGDLRVVAERAPPL